MEVKRAIIKKTGELAYVYLVDNESGIYHQTNKQRYYRQEELDFNVDNDIDGISRKQFTIDGYIVRNSDSLLRLYKELPSPTQSPWSLYGALPIPSDIFPDLPINTPTKVKITIKL